MAQAIGRLGSYSYRFCGRWQCERDGRDARAIRDRNDFRTCDGSVGKRSRTGRDTCTRTTAAGLARTQCHGQGLWQRRALSSCLCITVGLGQRRRRVTDDDPAALSLRRHAVAPGDSEVAETGRIA